MERWFAMVLERFQMLEYPLDWEFVILNDSYLVLVLLIDLLIVRKLDYQNDSLMELVFGLALPSL